MTPKSFFWVAEREYLLFDPKNGFKDVFWRNHLRAPQWHYNFKVTSQPPKPPKWPKNDFFELPRGNTCCLTLKMALRMYFEETTYELHSDITTSKWRHNPHKTPKWPQNDFFLYFRDWILAVWLQKRTLGCILKKLIKPPTSSTNIEIRKCWDWKFENFTSGPQGRDLILKDTKRILKKSFKMRPWCGGIWRSF